MRRIRMSRAGFVGIRALSVHSGRWRFHLARGFGLYGPDHLNNGNREWRQMPPAPPHPYDGDRGADGQQHRGKGVRRNAENGVFLRPVFQKRMRLLHEQVGDRHPVIRGKSRELPRLRGAVLLGSAAGHQLTADTVVHHRCGSLDRIAHHGMTRAQLDDHFHIFFKLALPGLQLLAIRRGPLSLCLHLLLYDVEYVAAASL